MRKLAFLFVLTMGCRPNSVVKYPTADVEVGPVLETLIMNWGEAPGVVRLATPRLPAIAEEVKKIRGVGIACYDELWMQESKDAVIQAAGPDMYYYYIDTRGENQRDGVGICYPEEAKKIAACARSKCSSLPAEEQTICVYEECSGELGREYIFGSHECVYCLVAGVGKSIEEILDNCVQQPGAPKIAGMERAFDGQDGVMVFSRYPLKNPEALLLRSSFSNRVALFVTVEITGFEPIEVACSHISTSTDLPPNHPDFSNWDDEMRAQVGDISRKLKERAGKRPSLFLADINAGPSLDEGRIKEMAPKVWKYAQELGFYSPAAHADKPFCTICADNTLRPENATNNYLIDHVFVRDPPGGTKLQPVLVHRIFDEEVVYEGYNHQWKGHLSDHYGTVVKFKLLNE